MASSTATVAKMAFVINSLKGLEKPIIAKEITKMCVCRLNSVASDQIMRFYSHLRITNPSILLVYAFLFRFLISQ